MKFPKIHFHMPRLGRERPAAPVVPVAAVAVRPPPAPAGNPPPRQWRLPPIQLVCEDPNLPTREEATLPAGPIVQVLPPNLPMREEATLPAGPAVQRRPPNLPAHETDTTAPLPVAGVRRHATANKSTQTEVGDVPANDAANPVRFTVAAARPQMADAEAQTDPPPARFPLLTLPNEILHQVMGYLVDGGLAPGREQAEVDNRAAARRGATSLAVTSKASVAVFGAELAMARTMSAVSRAATVADVQALLGTVQQPGPMRNLPPQAEQRALAQLLVRFDSGDLTMMDRARTCMLLRDRIGQLPQPVQAQVLEEGLQGITDSMSPRMAFMVGDTMPGRPQVPGTVVALPPELQVGPLRPVVDFVFAAETGHEHLTSDSRASLTDLVNRLPPGIGEDLKRDVARRPPDPGWTV